MSHDPADTPFLSVVVPAYNEAHHIAVTLQQIEHFARRLGRSVEVIIVDDGSTDDTAATLRRVTTTLPLRVLANSPNRGKGHSVRRGMIEARGGLRLMCDADMSTPLSQLEKMLPLIERGFDVVIASRSMPDSLLDPPQPLHRRLMGRVMMTLRGVLFAGTGVAKLRDTQCGFKLFTARAAADIFPRQHEEGFAFDVEVLALADRLGYSIHEVGVLWHNDPKSTVRPVRDSLRAIAAMFRIRARLNSLTASPAPEPR